MIVLGIDLDGEAFRRRENVQTASRFGHVDSHEAGIISRDRQSVDRQPAIGLKGNVETGASLPR